MTCDCDLVAAHVNVALGGTPTACLTVVTDLQATLRGRPAGRTFAGGLKRLIGTATARRTDRPTRVALRQETPVDVYIRIVIETVRELWPAAQVQCNPGPSFYVWVLGPQFSGHIVGCKRRPGGHWQGASTRNNVAAATLARHLNTVLPVHLHQHPASTPVPLP